MFRTSLAGTALAVALSGAAHATVVYSNSNLHTSSTVAAATGTNPSHFDTGLPHVGGLVGGSISFTMPGTASDQFAFDIELDDLSLYAGGIYELVLNGSSLGTTSIVGLDPAKNGAGDGSFSSYDFVWPGLMAGGTNITLGVTNLLQQYIGHTDNLPGLLGDASLNGGSVDGSFGTERLSIAVTATPMPEPTTVVLLGSFALLGAAARRRRQ